MTGLRAFVVVLVLCLVCSLPGVAAAAEYWQYSPDLYIGQPWYTLTDAQKQWIWSRHHTAAAMRYEQSAAAVAHGTSDAVRAYAAGTATEAEVTAAARQTLGSVTIGDVAEATGRTTVEVSTAVAKQTARAKASGISSWAKRAGVTVGEAVLPSILANAYLGYVDAHAAPYVHADGSECHWLGQCPGDEVHYLNPELRAQVAWFWPETEWSIEATGVVGYEFVAQYSDPAGVAGPTIPMDIRSEPIINYGLPSFPRWGEPEAALLGLVMATAYGPADQPIVPVFQQLNFSGYYRVNFRQWFNRVTGATTGATTYLMVDQADSYSKTNGTTVATLASEAAIVGQRDWYLAQIASLEAAGLIEAVEPSEVASGTVASGGPSVVLPPFVAAVTGLDDTGSFDPELTIDQATENVTIPDPADVPVPVYDATDASPADQTSVQPVERPFVDSWIGEVLDPILEPIKGLFEGLDIFWPFRFMAARG